MKWIMVLLLACSSYAQTPAQLKSQEEEMRELMISMSRQLGVTCTSCHNPENFRSSAKMEFKIAKEHMKITQLLIDNGMDGKKGPKASCYMCHQGQLKPSYKIPEAGLKK